MCVGYDIQYIMGRRRYKKLMFSLCDRKVSAPNGSYVVQDDSGQNINLSCKACWVPDLPPSLRLLSPQNLTTDKQQIVSLYTHGTLPSGRLTFAQLIVRDNDEKWNSQPPTQHRTIQCNPTNKLPELMVGWPNHSDEAKLALNAAHSLFDWRSK